MADKPCPECGAELAGLSSEELLAHRNDHWDEQTFDTRVHKEAIKRHGEITDLYEEVRAAERRGDDPPAQWKGGY